jgi:hypothetical protein
MVWATKRIKYSSILLLVILAAGCLFGVAYIAATTLMPYHLEYIGMSSADIQNFSPKLHNLILVFLKLMGLSGLLIMANGIVITLIPFRRAERWAWISLFAIGLIDLISLLAVTFYVGAWIKWVMLALIALFLVAMLIPVQDFFRKK